MPDSSLVATKVAGKESTVPSVSTDTTTGWLSAHESSSLVILQSRTPTIMPSPFLANIDRYGTASPCTIVCT